MRKHHDLLVRVGAIAGTFLVSVVNNDAWNAFYMSGRHPLFGLVSVAVFWELNRLVFLRAYRKLLPAASMGRRIAVIFAWSYLVCFSLRLCYVYGEAWLYQEPYLPLHTFIWNNVLNSLMSVWPFIVTYEILYVNRMVRLLDQEKEELLQAGLQRRYDSLQEQVQPHFLFNNLNSLSALIAKDREQAEEFVQQMSRVYRYLLRNNEENLIPLREELQFIESYNHLLQTRFGAGYQPFIQVPEAQRTHCLPPMTLQLLVENAVKHNIVSPEAPLRLEILADGDRLVVRNNLQKKSKAPVSSGVGLLNIRSRYRLLNLPPVEVSRDEENFTVIIPLIPASNESTDH